MSPTRILTIVVALVALVALGRFAGGYVPAFAAWVDGLGALGPIAFIAAYSIGVVAFLPGALLTLAGGAVFGLVEGTIYVMIAATLGACSAFLIARHAARAAVEQRVADSPRFAAIDRAIASHGRRIVMLLRLSPVFPFNLLNYALGLTRITFADYAISCAAMLPGTVLYVYYGKLAGDVAALAGGAAPERGLEYYLVLGLGLAATVVVTFYVTRLARRALDQATSDAPSAGGDGEDGGDELHADPQPQAR